MKALDRKLLRDLWHMRGQVIAISLVVACGVATFVMSLTTLAALERSQAAYYERYRFAEIFATLKRAPKSLVERIGEIPGVGRVRANIVADVNLTVPDFDEPVTGRLVSVPERRVAILNDLHLRAGRWIERGRGEALVSEAFAIAHDLEPGDEISAVLNGRYQRFRLVGIALSPEYIFQMQGGNLFPDDKRFGVLWVGYEELAASFDMKEAFNHIAATLMPETNEDEVIRRIDLLTEPYGGLGAHGRDQQVSHRFVSEEIQQLRAMAMVSPSIFLGVAAFLLNVVLNRMVSAQREQIAALKAFGYSRREVGLHYLKFGVVIMVIGSVLGIAGGQWLGKLMTELYGQFYRFPYIDYRLRPGIVALALLISGVAGTVAVLQAVARAVSLPPAEAMRPEPPATFRKTILETLGLGALLGPATRMMIRQLERRPVKALMSATGIAMATAVLVVGNFGEDAMDYLMDFQLGWTQRQDVTVFFVEPRHRRVLSEIEHLPGVLYAEGFRSVPCRLRSGHRSYLLGITGIPENAQLVRMVQADTSVITPPEGRGLIMSVKLAEILNVQPGDSVRVEVLEGKRPRLELFVEGLLQDWTGLSAYTSLQGLNHVMREGVTVSGAHLQVDERAAENLYRELREIPAITAVSVQKAALQSMEETIGENMAKMRAFNIFFACVIAFGVVYNNARIALAERSRELATLRVIGFKRSEVFLMLAGEMALLTMIAIPVGLVLGKFFVLMIAASAETEFYRFPAVVNRPTYVFAMMVISVATALSCLVILRRVAQLDLIEALKCKE